MDIENSLEWAIKIRKKMESELAKEELLPFAPINTENQLSIALMGTSQSGKTTLALRLLGAGDETENICEVLKGHRGQGESATIVATIYYVNKEGYIVTTERDDIVDEEKRFDSTETLKEYMQEMREKMHEEYLDKSSKPITKLKIGLPLGGENRLTSMVIDLVGLGAKDEWERVLSRRVTDRWLKYADIPLMVVNANKISDLDTKGWIDETKALIDRWHNMPIEHILVITWAYELANVRNKFSGISDSQTLFSEVSEYYKKQILHTAPFNALPENVFPINIVCGEQQKLWQDATEFALGQLENIMKQEPELYRIRKAFHYKESIEKSAYISLKELNDEIEKTKSDIDKKQETILKQESNIEELKNQKNKIGRFIPELNKAILRELESITKNTKTSRNKIGDHGGSYNRLIMKKCMNDFCISMLKGASTILEERKGKLEKSLNMHLDLEVFKIPALPTLSQIEQIFDYSLNTSGFGSHDRNIENFNKWVQKIGDSMIDWTNSFLNKYWTPKINDILYAIEDSLKSISKSISQLETQKEQIELEYNNSKNNLHKLEINTQKAIKIASRYAVELSCEFKSQSEKIREQIKRNIQEHRSYNTLKSIILFYKFLNDACHIVERGKT